MEEANDDIEITPPAHTLQLTQLITDDSALSIVSSSSITTPIPAHSLTAPEHTPSLEEQDSVPLPYNGKPHSDDLHQHSFKTFYRYYHVFVENELIALCERVPSLKVLSSWYDHENWCVLAQKLS